MSAQTSKGPKPIQAKNKTPAPVQISAEQLLREANERRLEYVPPVIIKKNFINSNQKNNMNIYLIN